MNTETRRTTAGEDRTSLQSYPQLRQVGDRLRHEIVGEI